MAAGTGAQGKLLQAEIQKITDEKNAIAKVTWEKKLLGMIIDADNS